MRSASIILTILVATAHVGEALAQEVAGCGTLQNAYGPFDYLDPAAVSQSLKVVEDYHFTSSVESLTRGSSGTVIGDLDYTLRAFPNHHRALAAVARYAIRGGKFDLRVPSAECYFSRAIAFRPDDASVRVLFGDFLLKTGDRNSAKKQYEEALALAPTSLDINYNAGLFFLAQGDLVRARQLAKIAYDGGYPLLGLQRKLKEAESKAPTIR